MGVLNDGNSTQAQPGAAKKATGYAQPLFTGSKPKFNDDRMIGGSAEKKELNTKTKPRKYWMDFARIYFFAPKIWSGSKIFPIAPLRYKYRPGQ